MLLILNTEINECNNMNLGPNICLHIGETLHFVVHYLTLVLIFSSQLIFPQSSKELRKQLVKIQM